MKKFAVVYASESDGLKPHVKEFDWIHLAEGFAETFINECEDDGLDWYVKTCENEEEVKKYLAECESLA